MSRSVQNFKPRCGNCQKEKREYHNLEFVRKTKDGSIVVKCLMCGKVSTRRSRSARRHLFNAVRCPACNGLGFIDDIVGPDCPKCNGSGVYSSTSEQAIFADCLTCGIAYPVTSIRCTKCGGELKIRKQTFPS